MLTNRKGLEGKLSPGERTHLDYFRVIIEIGHWEDRIDVSANEGIN